MVIQKVRSLRRGGGVIEKRTKTNSGRGAPGICVRLLFKKKSEILKMKFYCYSPAFPIDYNGSIKY